MKSTKRIKELQEIVKPFEVILPVDIELSVNNSFLKIKRNTSVVLSEAEYQVIMHSDYGKYLN